MNSIEKIAKKVALDVTELERLGWPPACVGLLYQPERPASATTTISNEDSNSHE